MRSHSSRIVTLAALTLGALAGAHAQNYFGAESYPHFRGMSGLSGGGFGVRPDGSTGMDGAMAISTPIGFSLRDWHGDLGVSSLSFDKSFTGVNILKRSSTFKSGGVADAIVGYGGRWGAVTVSYELLSTVLDHAWNVQYQLPIGGQRYGVSVGAQDVTSHGGAQGEGLVVPGANRQSRSLFVVGTALVCKDLYVSLGKGDIRFKNGVFGNASYSVTPRLKLVGEFDTWSWNYVVAYGLGKIPGFAPYGRKVEPVLSIGYVANQRALAMVNIAF
jgi:hypothetical protein